MRWVSLVLAVTGVASALTIGAAGCGDDRGSGAGQSGLGGNGRSLGRGGVGGSVGGIGVGGAGVAGAAGGATGGASGAGGQCQTPSGPAGSWVEVAPPAGQSGFRVTDVFAVGPNDLLFAGNTFDGLVPPTDARVLRWSQGCWTVEVTIPPSTGSPQFPSVNGTGPNDIWATGGDLLFHRDAQGWSRFADESWRGMVRSPPMFGPPLELRRVRAAAPGDVWVAATSNVLHWSGGQWTTYNFDDADYPNVSASIGFNYSDIWIDSPTDVWVGGPSDQVGNTMDIAFMHHFNGAAWTHQGVFLFSLDAIWRGGAVFWLAGAAPGTALNRFDGASATIVPIVGVDPTQRSVFMTSLFGHGAGDIWTAGDDVAHYDGQSWALVADAPAAARSTGTGDSRNTYVAGDAASVWLATPGPRFFRKATGP